VTITFLMFDSRGRPVPWMIDSFLLNVAGEGKAPALLRDPEHNRRAKLIAAECEYASPPGAGEDWRIQGIYEANDAHWKLIRPRDLQPYTDAMRINHRGRFTNLLPADPEGWHDLGSSNLAGPLAPLRSLVFSIPNPNAGIQSG